ncbi:hypothetical protein FRC09_017276 [Ceratobasidium sp. 395]|nr:hypothetical protein FRC09_017276 [Ceratobasidium sp. 395]
MEAIMKTELHGAVFLYEGFYDDFLGGAVLEIHNKIKKYIKSKVLKLEDSQWSFDSNPFTVGDEKKTYAPLVELLNDIGQAVYNAYHNNGADQFRREYRPFSDQHSQPMCSDYPSDAGVKPDLVKAKRPGKHAAHWGDVEMVVECKSHNKQEDQNEAYLQLARYARGIFSHQIYRLHVFGVAVCGPIVTFVRFDRSGLLHSPNINLSTPEGADSFVRHMITLLSLSALDFGYDPRYTFEPKSDELDKRFDTLFALDGCLPRIASSLLCHRKCCRGRATMASCLAAATLVDAQIRSSAVKSDLVRQFVKQEIVHKRIWRHEGRTDERTTLWRFEGVFAVCQVVAFRDNIYTTKVKYPSRLRYSRAAPHFIPTSTTQTTSAVTSASTLAHTTTTVESNAESTEMSDGSAGPANNSSVTKSETASSRYEHPRSATSDAGAVDVPEPLKSSADLLREVRIASDLLMPKGRPLSDAQSALHVAYAMHDTVLGESYHNISHHR